MKRIVDASFCWSFIKSGAFVLKDERTETEWKWKRVNDTLIIAFQATKSKKDWKQNFFFLPLPMNPYSRMKLHWFAHAGFVEKWRAVKNDVERVARLHQGKVKDIVITGHSQGGAIAQLCLEFLSFLGKDDVAVRAIVFGSPRVFWFWNMGKLRHRLGTLVRYEHRQDVVTRIPPAFMGYTHMGARVRVGKPVGFWSKQRIIDAHAHYGTWVQGE